jgi:transposase-like protein
LLFSLSDRHRNRGRRQVLGVELANRETRSSWRDFLTGLRGRGLHGVEFVVADDHAGLKASIRKVLPEAAYQRCLRALLNPNFRRGFWFKWLQ